MALATLCGTGTFNRYFLVPSASLSDCIIHRLFTIYTCFIYAFFPALHECLGIDRRQILPPVWAPSLVVIKQKRHSFSSLSNLNDASHYHEICWVWETIICCSEQAQCQSKKTSSWFIKKWYVGSLWFKGHSSQSLLHVLLTPPSTWRSRPIHNLPLHYCLFSQTYQIMRKNRIHRSGNELQKETGGGGRCIVMRSVLLPEKN